MKLPAYTLKTRFGDLQVQPTGLVSCSVFTPTLNGDYVTIKHRGIAVSVSHCFLVLEDGEWRTENEQGTKNPRRWSITRQDRYPAERLDPNTATHTDIKAAVLYAVTEFHDDHPEAFVDAERMKLAEHVLDCDEDVVKARRVLANEEAALRRATDALAEFEKEHPK